MERTLLTSARSVRGLILSKYVLCNTRVFATELEKKTFTYAKKSEFPSHHDVGVFADGVNQILQATPPKLRREEGMCGNAANEKEKKQTRNKQRASSNGRQPSNRVGGRVDDGTATAIPRPQAAAQQAAAS